MVMTERGLLLVEPWSSSGPSQETTGDMHVVTGVGQEDKFSFYYGSNGFLKQKTRCVVGLKHKTFKFNNPHKLEL